MNQYIFTSSRLGFRTWKTTDIDAMAQICADKDVMEYFPATLSRKETSAMIEKFQGIFSKNGYCYYAVDLLETNELLGFIGISRQEYDAGVENPFVDIGWRLKKSAWNKGLATEGAKRCLKHSFKTFNFKNIYAIATHENIKSMRIMEKIGMKKLHSFEHPLVKNPNFKKCFLYLIEQEEWKKLV